MRIIGSSGKDSWIVELSRQEMKRVDPQFDEDWRVHFRDVLNQISDNISVRVYNSLLRSLLSSLEDRKIVECFHKDGRLLPFEEWIDQPDYMERATSLSGIGPGGARQLLIAVERYRASKTVTLV